MRSVASKLILIYALASVVWIAVSDAFLIGIEGAQCRQVIYMCTASEALFLLITAFGLFKLINRYYYKLQQTEKQYRTYFEDNPTPMWIYNRKTLKFIAVNDAAVFNYGYTKDEFYNMTILDIRPPEDAERVIEAVNNFESPYKNSGIWRHKRKDGTIMYVHITSHLAISNNEPHVMIMAMDITQSLQAENKLQQANAELLRQNKLLREISWSQSHDVRRPLASILGLLNVMRVANSETEKELCINYIEISASELDVMVYSINEQINNAVYSHEPGLKPISPAIARLK